VAQEQEQIWKWILRASAEGLRVGMIDNSGSLADAVASARADVELAKSPGGL
jgi:hypothetical protein